MKIICNMEMKIMGDGEKKNILDNYSDVLTPVDLMSILHTGRTLTYKMLRSGSIKSVRAGRRYLIPKNILKNFLILKME